MITQIILLTFFCLPLITPRDATNYFSVPSKSPLTPLTKQGIKGGMGISLVRNGISALYLSYYISGMKEHQILVSHAVISNKNNFKDHKNTSPIGWDSLPENQDGKKFQEIMQYAISHKLNQKPMGEIIQAIAVKLLNAKYKAGLLDQDEKERLIISFTEFDCLIFVETVLALTRGIAIEKYDYQTFTDHIIQERYRNGKMNNYCDRLHYFYEWIQDNEKRGIVQNITEKLGGIKNKKKLNFMSSNREKYPQMVNNEANYQCIVNREKKLEEIPMSYIPKNKIKSIYPQLQPGDIIGVTTNIAGLDVTHTGLVYQQNKNIGLIHASPAGKVTIAPDLHRYVNNVAKATGIVIARPTRPR